MIKKIILGISILFSTSIFAQEGTASPYSNFGLGEVKFRGTVENRSMGGISTVVDTTNVNLQNPASYAFLKFTSFSIGGTNSRTNFKTNTQNEKTQRTTLDYLAVGIPMGKFGAAFGLMPYSNVGYKIQSLDTSTDPDQHKSFIGEGAVNRVFAGVSYRILPELSVGADFQYNFGSTKTQAVVTMKDILKSSRTKNTSKYSGFSTNLGAYYQKKISGKYSFAANVMFSPKTKITSENTRNVAVVTYSSSGAEIIEADSNTKVTLADTELTLPSKLTFGSGFGDMKKWFTAAEYVVQGKNDFTVVNTGGNFTFSHRKGERFSLGGYYIPKYNSFTSYFDRITYRVGYRYENTGLVINSRSIIDNAVTLGFGFPVGNVISKINLGLEYGKRGTRSNGLVEENYFNVSFGLSIGDRWFVKPKYD
ncbi:outer membrane protein transport protein [Flavobacterium sp. SM15]|uniref:outer membrane protein transport protein n=1 Tax=Flavobacterium sp. SM15 TaxID=2908005 RepID=UPI001EDB0712|nr:outer membrane protein transport protein [Flavobacterium sp. SM15]MCG2609982.1 outer membrane protein transport protein [Flavobacterium sp. SM15]